MAKKSLTNWMKIDYGERTKELHYSIIKKKIFSEEFLEKI